MTSVRHRVDVGRGGSRLPQPRGFPDRDDWEAWAPACLAACLALVALPVLASSYPPLFDYPNHLARAHVLAEMDRSAIFHAHFVHGGFLIPNVLADLVVLALLPVVGVVAAGKLLLLLTFALTLTGAVALNRRVAGRASPWPLLSALVLYNEGFFWGFLNYNLGLGLMLWGLACWGAVAERSVGWRLACGTAFALAVFLAHLVAFGLYAVAVAVLEVHRLASRWPGWRAGLRRLMAAAAQFAAPLLLFVTLSPSAGLAPRAGFDFSVFGKVMPFTRVLSSGNPDLDMATLVVLFGGVALALFAGVARCQGALVRVAAAFLLLVATLPFSLLGSYFLDSRIVVAVVLVLLASLAPGRLRLHPSWVAVGLLMALGIRGGVLAADWRHQDESYARVVAALDKVPVGSVIVTGVGYGFELGDWVVTRRVKPAHEHTTLYATIRRDALVPNIFAHPGQNPLVFRSPLPELSRAAANPVARVTEIGDARWLVQQVLPIADHRGQVWPAIPAVYVIGYRVPCDWWPTDMPLRVAACTPDFSLVEIIGGIEEPLP